MLADRPPHLHAAGSRRSFGPDLYDRETTSALADAAGATAAVNAGFFVLDPASGAPGDPAGAGVYDGRVLSEPTAGRPALVLHDDARGSAVRRLGLGRHGHHRRHARRRSTASTGCRA